MLEFVSPMRQAARAWLASWWPWRERAKHLAQQYAAARAEYPLVFADIARFGCAFDSTMGETRDETMFNTGKRALWLHIEAMSDLDEDDLRHLQGETDQ